MLGKLIVLRVRVKKEVDIVGSKKAVCEIGKEFW